MENKNINIMQIEGKDIIKGITVKGYKRYKASFDYSLDSRYLDGVINDNAYYGINNKLYSDDVISVTFNYCMDKDNELERVINLKIKAVKNYISNLIHCKEIEIDEKIKNIKETEVDKNKRKLLIIAYRKYKKNLISTIKSNNKFYIRKLKNEIRRDTEKVREELYQNGFILKFEDDREIEYIRYKRSSGSSREGKCLFINKKYYDEMMDWSLMGLDIKEGDEVDLASLEAYIALTTSSIIDTLEIDPKSILIIDDYESKFEDKVLATKNIELNGEEILVTNKEKIEISNSIWDGQSLIDKSILGDYENKGFLLLRNRFFKSACFNTNIQQFFEDNNITKISDLKGYTLAEDIKDIKLITTPSSVKIAKFSAYIKGGVDWKEHYLKNVESTFGIVKYEKPTHFIDGNRVQTHYQLLNTLQMDKDTVNKFLEPTIKYINGLRNDVAIFKNHLKLKAGGELMEVNSSDSLMLNLLKINDDVVNTETYKDYRKETIESYINNVKQGHVLVEGNYSVLLGNPIEMLQASIGKFDGKSLLDIDEVCSINNEENIELLGVRSPHVCVSNLWLNRNCSNEKRDIITKYVNLTEQIIVVNSVDNNVLERLSNCDFDSDAILPTNNSLLIEKARKNYENFLVPTSKVQGTKAKRYYTNKDKCDLDIKTSKNKIGEIINLAQILQSYMWDQINNNKMEIGSLEFDELYKDIAQLSIMSCIEIDKAKKEFKINNSRELQKIRNKWLTVENGLREETNIIKYTKKVKKGNKVTEVVCKRFDSKKMEDSVEGFVNVRPKFFMEVGEGKDYMFKKFDTAMDYVQEVVDVEWKKIDKSRGVNKNIIRVLAEDGFNKNKVDKKHREQASKLIKMVTESKNKTNALWVKKEDEEWTKEQKESKRTETNNIKNQLIEDVKNIKIEKEAIVRVLAIIEKQRDAKKAKKDISKKELNVLCIERRLLSVIFAVYQDLMLEIIKDNTKEVEWLVKRFDGDIDIYGIKYKKVNRQFYKPTPQNTNKNLVKTGVA